MSLRGFDNMPVYVLFAFYMCLTFGIAIYGMLQRKKNESSGTDSLEAHFLADKGFGVFVTSMNLIASLLTGYVVVGIPGDTAAYGYFTMSYIGALVTAIAFQAFFWPRLGGLARKRNWLSPNDFMSDRFNSKSLRLLTSVCGCTQLLFITAIEWMALNTMLTVLVDGDMDPKACVWILAGIVFVCEMMGGMNSVALTDAVQASFLVLSFALMPMLIASRWGGLDGMVKAGCSNEKVWATAWPDSPPAWGTTTKNINGSAVMGDSIVDFNGHHNQTLYGCIAHTSVWMLWTPPKELTNLCFSVMTVFISWPIQPMAMHRVMVAKDGRSVKASILSFLLFPCLIFLPGIVMGIAAAAEFPMNAPANAFMTVCGSMFNQGGFFAFVATLFMTSSIAAFMSTSDSIVLAVSNTLTVDLVKNWLWPKASTPILLVVSKLISLSTLCLGVILGLYSGLELFDFVNIAQGFMNCVLAPYYIGLYWDRLSASACTLSTVISIIVLLSVEYGVYQKRAAGAIIGDSKILSSAWCAASSIGCSIFFTVLFALIWPKLNDDDDKADFMKWDALGDAVNSRYGKSRLSVPIMKRLTSHIKQPSDSVTGWVLFAFAAIAPAASLPWGKDEFKDEGIRGPFPMWASNTFIAVICSMMASAIMALFFYDPGNGEAPVEDMVVSWSTKSGAHFGSDANLMRRMSESLLTGKLAPQMAGSIPGPQMAQSNQVMPTQSQVPGVVFDDDEMLT